MKFVRLFFLSIIVLSIIALHSSFAQQMRFDTMIRDLGEMRQMESREVRFTVYNSGAEVLHLSRVRAGCGCTQARLSSNELAPGDSATISVVFATGPHMLGDVTKSLEIGQMLDGREVNVQKLRIRTDVVGELKFQPARLSFRANVGDTVRLRLLLVSNSDEAVPVGSIVPELTAFVDTTEGNTYRAERVITETFEGLAIAVKPESVAVGETEPLELIVLPTKRGQISGFLRIALPSSEIRVPLTGVVLNSN